MEIDEDDEEGEPVLVRLYPHRLHCKCNWGTSICQAGLLQSMFTVLEQLLAEIISCLDDATRRSQRK